MSNPIPAWLLTDFTGLGAMTLSSIPEQQAGPNEVCVDVAYAALNPADRFLAEGLYPAKPKLPHVLGRDGLGTIRQVGPYVQGWSAGDRVILLRSDVGVERWGTFAGQVIVPAESIAPIPKGWSDEQAAGAALVYLTAYQALTQWGEQPPGGVVLVTGASGGVGVATVHLAKAMGHTVVALSRSPDKRQRLQHLGADVTLDPEDADWPAKLKTALPGRRVDLAVDNIAGPLLLQVLDTLGMNGRISLVGQLGGPVPNLNVGKLFFKRLRMGGVYVGNYTAQQSQQAWEQVVKQLDSKGYKPLVDQVFPFAQLVNAFGHLQRGPMGKVVLQV